MLFHGCGTALVTPFRKDGSLDEPTLRALVRRQIDAGINFLVPCGTTGENPTLSRREHLRVVEITLEEAHKRVPVLAGAGGYNTAEVIELAREVRALGADGILSVTPYYNKPTQEGIYQHFKAIATAADVPLVVYNIQGRTATNIETATLKRLAEIDNIIGVKEASGHVAQIAAVIHQLPRGFAVLSGDDVVTLPLIALGGHGVICTVSNEIPAEMTELTRRALNNDFPGAREILRKYLPLIEVNGVETNPIPVKTGMALMGLLEPVWRLPMCPPSSANHAKIEKVLETLGLLAGRSVHAV
ncbi:MAG TPA: 4-hydroxy-tetrahydrodipicolinate synthase [Bryobacteraceae bacterium]|nr:4-hydroxy-tetrahydrodipicolinate synthase [Bryobacteraceae bacterium]